MGSVGRALSRNEDRKSVDCKGLACNQSHFLSLRRQQLPNLEESHLGRALASSVDRERGPGGGSGQWAVGSGQ